jgi:hypothetical protein
VKKIVSEAVNIVMDAKNDIGREVRNNHAKVKRTSYYAMIWSHPVLMIFVRSFNN